MHTNLLCGSITCFRPAQTLLSLETLTSWNILCDSLSGPALTHSVSMAKKCNNQQLSLPSLHLETVTLSVIPLAEHRPIRTKAAIHKSPYSPSQSVHGSSQCLNAASRNTVPSGAGTMTLPMPPLQYRGYYGSKEHPHNHIVTTEEVPDNTPIKMVTEQALANGRTHSLWGDLR